MSCPRRPSAGGDGRESAPHSDEEESMAKWECKVCGWVYDEETGDAESGAAPGTKFEDLPDDWVCPLCGAPKKDFEKIESG
jgi:rubredoxin